MCNLLDSSTVEILIFDTKALFFCILFRISFYDHFIYLISLVKYCPCSSVCLWSYFQIVCLAFYVCILPYLLLFTYTCTCGRHAGDLPLFSLVYTGERWKKVSRLLVEVWHQYLHLLFIFYSELYSVLRLFSLSSPLLYCASLPGAVIYKAFTFQ